VGCLLGHEGPGSILSKLKKKGWAYNLSCFTTVKARGIELFKIKVYLTEEGVQNVDGIVKLIFQVIFYLFR